MIDLELLIKSFDNHKVINIPEYPNIVHDNLSEIFIKKYDLILKQLDTSIGNRDLHLYIESLGELYHLTLKFIHYSGLKFDSTLDEMAYSKLTKRNPNFSHEVNTNLQYWETYFNERSEDEQC